MTSDPSQAVAIIASAGRFPGAPSVAALWAALREGRELTRALSDEVLRARGVSDRDLRDPSYIRRVGLLDDVELFDRGFFRLSPREARLMDPQHRVFLEIAHLALEQAGYAATARPQCIGVFAGAAPNTYFFHHVAGSAEAADYGGWGVRILSQQDALAARVAYHLNLTGPAVVVQTACSTSLVAVHLATQAVLAGECDMALAGGVSIRIPQVGYPFQEGGILSPDGRCRAFDAEARGTVPGDGAGVVLLKRLVDATRDGDEVLAVVIGSATSNDAAGRVGFTAPSPQGQASAIRQALAVARVDPQSVSYIETHGTGTPLGDSVEIAALADAYGGGPRCAIGSIKSNIGHLDTAAGIAGLIKATLCLRHRTLPKSLHVATPNPALAHTRFEVVTQTRPWLVEGPLRAGVSSFGIGGTNAHVVLERAPDHAEPAIRSTSRRPTPQLLTLSAKSGEALGIVASRHLEVLEGELAGSSDVDIAFTANCRRPHHDHRLAIVGAGRGEWAALLRSYLAGEATSGVMVGRADAHASRLAFVFSGQGTQWYGMGRELFEDEAVFRGAIIEIAAEVRAHAGWDLIEELGRSEVATRLRDTSIAQPCLFALQVALHRLLQAWGVEPTAFVGHSLGEIAAAHASGALSLSEATRLAVVRGRIMHATVGQGRMIAVELDATAARRFADETPGIELAASNGPRATVLAGAASAVERALGVLAARGVRAKQLDVDYAFHSDVMTDAAEALAEAMSGLTAAPPSLAMASTLDPTDRPTVDAGYWGRQVRRPVRFYEAIQRLVADGYERFVELGPQPVLVPAVIATLEELGKPGLAVATARRGHAERATLFEAVGRLHCSGHPIDFARCHAAHGRVVSLPPYPFAQERHWIDASVVDGPLTEASTGLARPVDTVRTDLTGLDRDSRIERVLGFVRAFVASSTALPESMISGAESLVALGVDSLSTLALKERLREQLGVVLATATAAAMPSLRALAEHLVDRLDDGGSLGPAGGPITARECPGLSPESRIVVEERQAVRTTIVRPYANGYEHHVLEWAPAHAHGTAFLVHGYLDAAASWELVAPTLAASGLRVLAPDLRGCGEGARVPPGAHYHFADHVRDLAALVETLCHDQPIFLVGHSLGGLISLSYAGSFPERVSRLALLEGVGMAADTPQGAPLRLRRWCLDTDRAREDAFRFEDAIARFAVRNPDVSETVLRERLRHLVRATETDRYVWKIDPRARAGADSLAPEVLKAFLQQISCPVLAVGGGASPLRAADEAERLAACASLTRTELDGAGHMIHWTRPEALADLLVGFSRTNAILDVAASAHDERRQAGPSKEHGA